MEYEISDDHSWLEWARVDAPGPACIAHRASHRRRDLYAASSLELDYDARGRSHCGAIVHLPEVRYVGTCPHQLNWTSWTKLIRRPFQPDVNGVRSGGQ